MNELRFLTFDTLAPAALSRLRLIAIKDWAPLSMQNIRMLGKLFASIFLIAVMLTPVAIVVAWRQSGAIWVAGYVAGIITVPLIGVGALRATSRLFDDKQAFIAFFVFGFVTVTLSLAAAFWAYHS